MKTLLSFLLPFLIPITMFAQYRPVETGRIFGVGVRTSIFQSSEIQQGFAPLSRLLVNADAMKTLRTEAQFGYLMNAVKSDNDLELKSGSALLGFGLHYLINRNDNRFSVGLRYTWLTSYDERVVFNDDGYGNANREVVRDYTRGYSVNPVLGGEHFFSNWFSVGAEFAVAIGESKYEPHGSDYKPKVKSYGTETSVMFRFYPF